MIYVRYIGSRDDAGGGAMVRGGQRWRICCDRCVKNQKKILSRRSYVGIVVFSLRGIYLLFFYIYPPSDEKNLHFFRGSIVVETVVLYGY